MKKKNIVFMGTPPIAVAMLERIIEDEYHVIGVVTQPDKKVGRKQLITMSAVKETALQHDIPVYQPLKIREDYQQLMQLPIDLIVTCAYGQFIPQELLDYPTFGSINVHASLLPKLRGGAPIHKAIINGETKTGMSIMRMVKKMDAGDVMARCTISICEKDTTGDLYDRLAIEGAKLLSESMPKIFNNTAVFNAQNEAEATFAYTICKEEEYIDFQKPLRQVYNQIRGLIPFPIGYAIIGGKKIKFHKVAMKEASHTYGTGVIIGMMDACLAVACEGGFLLIEELQMEGKAKVDAKAFFNGAGKQLINHCFLNE